MTAKEEIDPKSGCPINVSRYCPNCGEPQRLPPLDRIKVMLTLTGRKEFPEMVDAAMRCRSCGHGFWLSEVAPEAVPSE